MSEQFKIGDVCEGQNFVRSPDRNGMQCTIIGGLEIRRGRIPQTTESFECLMYRVHWADDDITAQPPYNLRKKRPPASDSGERSIMELFDRPLQEVAA